MATAVQTRQSAPAQPIKVLVVGQTPPPYHGQAIMIERLVRAEMDGVRLYHVRMAFSRRNGEVGQFRFGKVCHLLTIVLQIINFRVAKGIQVLYYPPAGPNRNPMLRDMVILLCTRWLFRHTLFHMQASGISQLYGELGIIGRWLFRRAYFGADGVVQTSELTDDAGKLRAERRFVVHNSADDQYLCAATRPARDDNTPVHLLYLGTVCRSKGISVLLDACRELLERGCDFRLNVVGSFQPPEFQSVVTEKVCALGLDRYVELRGEQTGDDKLLSLAEADAFCFPSFYESEGLPLCIIEAMSFALPIVATRWRGIPSIVSDGETGFLVRPQNSGELADPLEQLIGDAPLRLRLGKAGRARFLQEFTTERHLEMMQDVFAAVCRTGGGPRRPTFLKRSGRRRQIVRRARPENDR